MPYAKDLRGKLLVIHGMSDDNVLFLELARSYFDGCRISASRSRSWCIPVAKHGLMRQHDGRHAYATMLRFFNASLMPAEALGADSPGAGAPRAAAAPP